MSTLAVRGLKPRPVWKYFEKLAEIPRPSGHEGQVLAYLKRFAESRGLQHFSDEAGNLAIHRPGQHGGESQPGVMIQGHVDMVTEKNAARADFDFLTDPIELVVAPGKHVPVRFGEEERGAGAAAEVVEGEDLWVRANGTTLGADNGIGVAMALAVLDDEGKFELIIRMILFASVAVLVVDDAEAESSLLCLPGSVSKNVPFNGLYVGFGLDAL